MLVDQVRSQDMGIGEPVSYLGADICRGLSNEDVFGGIWDALVWSSCLALKPFQKLQAHC